jgi:hypothetical protein
VKSGLRWLPLLLSTPWLCLGLAAASAQPAMSEAETLRLAKSDYVEHCGGCHGIQGKSAPALIPELRDRIGYFLCTPEARAYLIRLPNVAHSRLSDNAQLAEMLNFTVFGLGGASAPAGAPRFTAGEVERERKRVLAAGSLKKMRASLVDGIIRKCNAPASLRDLYPGQTKAQ